MQRLPYDFATQLLDTHEHLFPDCFFDTSEYTISRGSFAFVWSHPSLDYIIKATICPYNVQYLASINTLHVPTYTDTDAFITLHSPITPCAESEAPTEDNPSFLISWCQMPLGIPHHHVSGAIRSYTHALSSWLRSLHSLSLQTPSTALFLLQQLPVFQHVNIPEVHPSTPSPRTSPEPVNLSHICYSATLLEHEVPTSTQIKPLYSFTNSDLLQLPPTISQRITTYRKWIQKSESLNLSPIQKTILLDCYHAASITYPALQPRLDNMHEGNLLLLPLTAINTSLLPTPLPNETHVLFPHDLLYSYPLLKTLQNATNASLLLP